MIVSPDFPSLASSWMALGINNAGQIVGHGTFPVASWKQGRIINLPGVALWDQGTIIKLPILPGGISSEVNAINDAGQIVGWSDDGEVFKEGWGVLWDGGQIINLGGLPGARGSTATAINNRGQIAGSSTDAGKDPHAVRWEGDACIELPYPPGGQFSEALGINDAGQIVGWSATGEDVYDVAFQYEHAVLWEGGEIIALPSLPGHASCVASAINNAGQVVGYCKGANGDWHAVLWQDGEVISLGALPGDIQSEPEAINDRGQVVGASNSHHSFAGHSRAVLWQDGEVIELPRFPVLASDEYSHATDINDHGQIVGFARRHALLWDEGTLIDLGPLPATE